MIDEYRASSPDAERSILPRGWRWKPVLLVVVSLIGVFQLVQIFRVSPWVWHDFTQDHVGITEALAGRNPYLPQNQRIAELFNIRRFDGPAYSFHPPSTLVFFLPLAPLPYRVAFIVWGLVNLLCLWAIVYLTARCVERPLGATTSVPITLGLVAVWPIRENFVEGQLNIPVTAGLVASWYFLRSDRRGIAGIALAAAVALKPLAGLVILWAIWRREWRFLAFVAVGLITITTAGIALAGIDGTRDYVTTAYPLHAALWPGFPDNASPQGFFSRLFGPNQWRRPVWPEPQLSTPLTLVTWAVLIGVLFQRLGPKPPTSLERLNLEMAAVYATMPLVTPIIWPHYYVALIPTLAVLGVHLWGMRHWRSLAALGMAVFILWIPRNEIFPRGIGNIQLPALLTIYTVAVMQLGRQRVPEPEPRSRWAES